jgi:hypothetical protein
MIHAGFDKIEKTETSRDLEKAAGGYCQFLRRLRADVLVTR